MHELPITQSILEIALRYAQEAQAVKITDLYLVIGQLSSVIDDSIQFHWEILSQDTIAEGSRLHFERIPAKLTCLECGNSYILEEGIIIPCPQCGSFQVKVIEGEEFRLESIAIEE
ncbi:MAG: hydrogenase maturation nickel metallochaperone HypA [Anaerolineales bacterium]|jgi:hydrogenase nickel incorporation protein HypA/HybF